MIHRPTLFLAQTFVILLVAAVHLAALEWYLYWYYPWLDLLTHFLGGLWIALASVWVISYTKREVNLFHVIGIALTIGIGWEIFEYFAGTPREANFIFDTLLDLAMDFGGGLFGYLITRQSTRDTITAQ